MTAEEIKLTCSMQDVLNRYGMQPNRHGYLRCPFHDEKTASMKIYKDSYYCYGCGASGDVLSFIKNIEQVDFKTALQKLGGGERADFKVSLQAYRIEKERQRERRHRLSQEEAIRQNQRLITVYRLWLARLVPLTNAWCDCQNALQEALYQNEILTETG